MPSSPDIGLDDVDKAAALITSSAHPEANIIWGASFDENMKDEMCITVIATGFDAGMPEYEAPVSNPAANFNGFPGTAGAAQPQMGYTSAAAQQPVTPAPVVEPVAPAEPAQENDKINKEIDDLLNILNNSSRGGM